MTDELEISHFRSIIENYEEVVQELTCELNAIKKEHENLKSHIYHLTEENQKLSENLRTVQKNFDSAIIKDPDDENDLIRNLKRQIDCTLNEKEYTVKLWRNAVETIDHLEEELQIFHAGSHNLVPKKDVVKIKATYEEKIHCLETKLISTQEKLEETTKFHAEIKNNQTEKSLDSKNGAFKIIKNLEEELLNLQNRLRETSESRTKLEKEILNKESLIQELKKLNTECRAKVNEAVSVVEAALNEKDAALLRENELRDELEKLSQTTAEVVQNSTEKLKIQLANTKSDYEQSLKSHIEQLKDAQNESKIKTIEIEKYVQKCEILQNEITKLKTGNVVSDDSHISRLLILEKNLESTFQKLLLSEKQNIQLTSERDTIKNDMEQMAGMYERNIKTKEIECATLQNKIRHLQTELEETNANLRSMHERLEQTKSEIDALNRNYLQQKLEYEKYYKITV